MGNIPSSKIVKNAEDSWLYPIKNSVRFIEFTHLSPLENNGIKDILARVESILLKNIKSKIDNKTYVCRSQTMSDLITYKIKNDFTFGGISFFAECKYRISVENYNSAGWYPVEKCIKIYLT